MVFAKHLIGVDPTKTPTKGLVAEMDVSNSGRPAVGLPARSQTFAEPRNREIVQKIRRYLQAGCEVSGLMGRLPSEMGYQPTLAYDLGVLEARIASTSSGGATCHRSTRLT